MARIRADEIQRGQQVQVWGYGSPDAWTREEPRFIGGTVVGTQCDPVQFLHVHVTLETDGTEIGTTPSVIEVYAVPESTTYVY